MSPDAGHKSLAEALVAFQKEAPTLPKDASNPHFKSKFTSLDTIVETVRPLLAKHGLAWSALPCFGPNGEPALRYQLLHAASGEVVTDAMPLLLTKQDSQGLGSALTYSRRYSLSAVLNLVSDDDDDWNAASRPQAPAQWESVSAQDIEGLKRAAKGLDANQIKMALTACGIPVPNPLVWNAVPKAKASILYEALSETPRAEQAA